jgi:serine/threonine protein kinase
VTVKAGDRISHYRVLEKLGEGGMGVVYKAHDLTLDRPVAIKLLTAQFSADDQEKQRFIQEAKAASALDHPNICTIHEIGQTEDGQMFIVMACYEGRTLKVEIQQCALALEKILQFAVQIVQGLAKVHQKGIVHRDIKPANIFITNDDVVKIVDFGLAKLAGQTKLTKTGSTVGTVAYMSPEQARGETVDHRTDIWSFGAVLYEMLTGRLPFKGDYEQAVIYSIINDEPQPIEALPAELTQIVTKCLCKDPHGAMNFKYFGWNT